MCQRVPEICKNYGKQRDSNQPPLASNGGDTRHMSYADTNDFAELKSARHGQNQE